MFKKCIINTLRGEKKMEERTKISLITIPLNHIFHLAQLFCKEKPSREPKKRSFLDLPILNRFCYHPSRPPILWSLPLK